MFWSLKEVVRKKEERRKKKKRVRVHVWGRKKEGKKEEGNAITIFSQYFHNKS